MITLKKQWYFLSILLFMSFTQSETGKITWKNTINEEFNFVRNWSYPENVYKNSFGQLSCDNFCPERAYSMKDEEGKIIQDSLKAFYDLVDTSHMNHNIKSESNTYEWNGTNFIDIISQDEEKLILKTQGSVSTHSKLVLEIEPNNNRFEAFIQFNSITPIDDYTFKLYNGSLIIDRELWKKGILKAKFDFLFDNSREEEKPIYWKGKIYKNIK